jgi:hypothetical protein
MRMQEGLAMKLFLMKLCSLLVLIAGALLLAWGLGISPVIEPVMRGYAQVVQADTLPPRWLEIIIAASLMVLGAVAFLPRLSGPSMRRTLRIPTEHGNVAVQLEALRPALLKVLRKMPEIRKVRLNLKPSKARDKVHIIAHIALRQDASLDVQHHVDIVAAHIAESTVRLLGLENMAEVEVIVDGINVNARAAAKAVQEEAQNFRAHLASHAKTEELAVAAASAAAALDHVAVAAQHNEEAAPFAQLDAQAESDAPQGEEEPYVEWNEEDADTDATAETPGVPSENVELLAEADLPAMGDEPTINRDDSDVSYALPPLSEQEEDEAEADEDGMDDFDTEGLAEQHRFNSGVELIGENELEEEREEEEKEALLTGSAPQVDDLAPSPFKDAHGEASEDDATSAFAQALEEASETEDLSGAGSGEAADETDDGSSDKKRWSFF